MRLHQFCLFIACCSVVMPAIALRCGTHVIDKGDSASRVSRFCGEPDSVQTRSVFRTRSIAAHRLLSQTGSQVSGYDQVTVEIVLEAWEYNFGPNRLAREVIFEDGVVANIKSVGYGY